jgi:hypothetical protein
MDEDRLEELMSNEEFMCNPDEVGKELESVPYKLLTGFAKDVKGEINFQVRHQMKNKWEIKPGKFSPAEAREALEILVEIWNKNAVDWYFVVLEEDEVERKNRLFLEIVQIPVKIPRGRRKVKSSRGSKRLKKS